MYVYSGITVGSIIAFVDDEGKKQAGKVLWIYDNFTTPKSVFLEMQDGSNKWVRQDHCVLYRVYNAGNYYNVHGDIVPSEEVFVVR